ncbi:hypothetical protein IRJ41_017255, partial [Triplophysa rosa]
EIPPAAQRTRELHFDRQTGRNRCCRRREEEQRQAEQRSSTEEFSNSCPADVLPARSKRSRAEKERERERVSEREDENGNTPHHPEATDYSLGQGTYGTTTTAWRNGDVNLTRAAKRFAIRELPFRFLKYIPSSHSKQRLDFLFCVLQAKHNSGSRTEASEVDCRV